MEADSMKTLAGFIGILLIAIPANAQHGQASTGYYPQGYSGDTWTGVVTAVNESTGEFTLTYTKGNKTQTFTGVPQEGYTVAPKHGSEVGPERPLKPSDIHIGKTFTVLYIPVTNKVDGNKVTVNVVFYIDAIPNNKRGWNKFQAFQ
jgi:hypothetical protein